MSVVEVANVPVPAAPRTLEESGLNIDLVTQLALKTLHLAGTLTGLDLATRLGLHFSVIEPSLDELKWQHHVEIVAGSTIGGAAYKYRITDAGRERAALFMEHNHYVGVAPVPLEQYRRYLENFQRTTVNDGLARSRPIGLQFARAQRPRARPTRAGRPGRAIAVRVRPAGKRQDRHLAVHPEPAGRRDRRAARPGRRGRDHPLLRPGQPRGG